MSKVKWKPGTLMAPLPVYLAGCGNMDAPNLITVAWCGIVNSEPPMAYISVRPSRHSYHLIKESGCFTLNAVSRDMVRKTDSCGVYSGAKVNKFEKFSLTPVAADEVDAPIVAESPLALECKVKQIIPLGSHDLFLADIVAVQVEESLINEDGKLQLGKAHLIAYSHGDYMELGKKAGSFGFSVKKRSKKTEGKKKQ